MSKTKKAHGGKRKGAGRPCKYPGGPTRGRSIQLPVPVWNRLSEKAEEEECSVSSMVMQLVEDGLR